MTVQRPDSVVYNGKDYSIGGIHTPRGPAHLWEVDNGLFHPEDYGIEISYDYLGSNMERGYWCLYKIEDGQFLLDKFMVRPLGEPPIIFGKSLPSPEGFMPSYDDLQQPIPFNGGLLLCANEVGDDGWLGFPSACDFSEVHEMIFQEGAVQSVQDRSEDMKLVRLAQRRLRFGMQLTPEIIEKKEVVEELVNNYLKRWF